MFFNLICAALVSADMPYAEARVYKKSGEKKVAFQGKEEDVINGS